MSRPFPLLLVLGLVAASAAVFAQPLDLTVPAPDLSEMDDNSPPTGEKEDDGVHDVVPERVETLDLPAWQDPLRQLIEMRLWPGNHGGGLFPPEIWPLEPEPVLPEMEFVEAPPADAAAQGTEAPEPLSPELAATYFGTGPHGFFHDPQHLLPLARAAALERLVREALNAAGQFRTGVIVLKSTQQIPLDLNPVDLMQRWHRDAQGLTILYFLGRPERTQAFFSAAVHLEFRVEDLRHVIDFGVQEARRITGAAEQLERFCYMTAVRIDRLRKSGRRAPPEGFAADVPSGPGRATLWWAFAIGVHAAGAAAVALWWWRKHRPVWRHRGTVVFPEQDFHARLGGPHSGGGGAVFLFAPGPPRI